ncbi:unnamed protein product [Enterobius vermicularis]|uniref:Permease n=1 Tax=Enterobius vermicularis TaxID=51028 RepID=A0A0N4VDH0_ENTVE|nr:unnamed protein product [Enterobius vermicularis]
MSSALIPIFIGTTGLVGMFTKFIGPITVSPLIILLAASSVDMCVERISKHWVSVIQAIALFIVVLYLADWKTPLPSIRKRKFSITRHNIFGQYPYLIAILVSWGFCLFLTLANLTPPDSAARLDKNGTLEVIKHADWFTVPYPGEFGTPKFHAGLFFAFVLSAMTSVFESVGDYHAAARVSDERAPATHAINRGIIAEGVGSLFGGLLGPGVGITTHTENIGVIGITKVSSRATMVTAGVLLICLGCFTKLGAVLSTIPDPLVGGVLASSMAMVCGIAIANLQQVDLTLSRNIAIIGFSIMVGLIVPRYFAQYPVHTGLRLYGVETLDQVLHVLFTLPMFVGALTACILDNTVQGATREQRGLRSRGLVYDFGESGVDIYAFPPLLMKIIKKFPILTNLPFIPREKRRQMCDVI